MSKIADDFKALGGFFHDCRAEFHKITWPKRNELIGSTKVVASVIGLLALFVFFSDQLLSFILKFATR
jgi:preprotein translocase, SecE subunit, bacterial